MKNEAVSYFGVFVVFVFLLQKLLQKTMKNILDKSNLWISNAHCAVIKL